MLSGGYYQQWLRDRDKHLAEAERRQKARDAAVAQRKRQGEKEASKGKSAFKKYTRGSGRKESRNTFKRPDGVSTRNGRANGSGDAGLDRAAVAAARREAAEREQEILRKEMLRKAQRRANVIRARLESRLQRIEQKRQQALVAVTAAEEKKRLGVERGIPMVVAEANREIAKWNGVLLEVEHEEMTAYGLKQRSEGFDRLEAMSRIRSAQVSYTGRKLGDPVPLGQVVSPQGARGDFGYGSKVRDMYTYDFKTKPGEAGHAKEIRRSLTTDIALAGAHAEWWDTEQGAQQSSDIFVAHYEAIQAHEKAVSDEVDLYSDRLEGILTAVEKADKAGNAKALNRGLQRLVALKQDKGYQKADAEHAALYGRHLLDREFHVKRSSDMGLTWYYDAGVQYVLDQVKRRQNAIMAYGPNRKSLISFEKAVDLTKANVQSALMDTAKTIYDPIAGVYRKQFFGEVLAEVEAAGMTAEQAAAMAEGFTAGQSVIDRARETERHPVFKHLYRRLMDEGVETQEDFGFGGTVQNVQLHVMPDARDDAMNEWKLSKAYKPPGNDRIYRWESYVTLDNGERGFIEEDGRITTRETWGKTYSSITGVSPEPLWDACSLNDDRNTKLCPSRSNLDWLGAEATRLYDERHKKDIERQISAELNMDWRDNIATGPLNALAAAPMYPLSKASLELQQEIGARIGIGLDPNTSAFDDEDYVGQAHQIVDKWKREDTWYDPGEKYGLFDFLNYGTDEKGVFFRFTPESGPNAGKELRIRRGEALPVPEQPFWSPNGRIEPIWYDPYDEAYGSYAENAMQSRQEWMLEQSNHEPVPARLEELRYVRSNEYLDNAFQSALRKLRGPDRLHRLMTSPDDDWVDVEVMRYEDMELNPKDLTMRIIANTVGRLGAVEVVRARNKRDNRIVEEWTVGIDMGDDHSRSLWRLEFTSGPVIQAELDRDVKAIEAELASGDFGVAFEYMNRTGRVFHTGDAAEMGNFLIEFFGDATNFLPFLNIAKRGMNGVKAAVAEGRIAKGSPLQKLSAIYGRGREALVTHPDLYRVTSANAKDFYRATGLNDKQGARFFERDLAGMSRDIDSKKGFSDAVDDMVGRILDYKTGVDPEQLRNWIEARFTHVLRQRGIIVHTMPDESLAKINQLEADDIAADLEAAELAHRVQQRRARLNVKARWELRRQRRYAAAEAKRRAQAAAAAGAPPPFTATPPAGAAPGPGPAPGPPPSGPGAPPASAAAPPPGPAAGPAPPAAPPPRRASDVGAAPPPRAEPTMRVQTTPFGVKRGQPQREVNAHDLVRMIDKQVQRAEDLRRRAQSLPEGAIKADLEEQLVKAVARRDAYDRSLQRLRKVKRDLDALEEQVRLGQKGSGLSEQQIAAHVREAVEMVMTSAGYKGVTSLAGARRVMKQVQEDFGRAIRDIEFLHHELNVGAYPVIDDAARRAIESAQRFVEYQIRYARVILGIANSQALFKVAGRSADEVNEFLDRRFLSALADPKPVVEVMPIGRAIQQARRSNPAFTRAPANMPQHIREEYTPGAMTGSYDDDLRALEHKERQTWLADQGVARTETYSTGWDSGKNLYFPDLREVPGSSLKNHPIVHAFRRLRYSTKPGEAINAYEQMVLLYRREWDRYLVTAKEEYPTGYPVWLAGGYADRRAIEELGKQNEAIRRAQGFLRVGEEAERILYVVDSRGLTPPRLYHVREADYRLTPGADTAEDFARLRAREQAITDKRRDPSPGEFHVYDIGNDLNGYGDFSGDWYQPPRPYSETPSQYLAGGGAFDELSRQMGDLSYTNGMTDDALDALVDRIVEGARTQWGDGPGVLNYRRSIQPVFDLFHVLHDAALAGDEEAYATLLRMHDVMSRRLLDKKADPFYRPFVTTYLMMESRVGLPFSIPIDFMEAQFRDAALLRGMFPHRALQMIQHKYKGIGVPTPGELNPAILPIFEPGAGVKVDGRVEQWAPVHVPERVLSVGKAVTMNSKGKPIQKPWQSLYDLFTGKQRDLSVVEMVRTALMLLEVNTARHGTWLSSVPLHLKASPLRAAVLERGVHGLVSSSMVKVDGAWKMTAEGAPRLRALYANWLRYSRHTMPVGVAGFDPDAGRYVLEGDLAKAHGESADFLELQALVGAEAAGGFVSFGEFSRRLGQTLDKHLGETSSMVIDPLRNPFGISQVNPGGKYASYGDPFGDEGLGLRTAWERGVHGGTGWAPIASSTPYEAVMTYLVHRGYWTDASRHSAAVKRANMFLDDMEHFASTTGDASLYADAKKLVLDLNQPSFMSLRRRMLDQAGAPGRDARRWLMAMAGERQKWTGGKIGNLRQLEATPDQVGALYMRVSDDKASRFVDEIMEEHKKTHREVKEVAFEDSEEASEAARDLLGSEYFEEKYPQHETGMAEVAPTLDELQIAWSRLKNFSGRLRVRKVRTIERRPTEDEVTEFLRHWEHDLDNGMPMHPNSVAHIKDKPELQALVKRTHDSWTDRRNAAENDFRYGEVEYKLGTYSEATAFVYRLIHFMDTQQLNADDWASVEELFTQVRATIPEGMIGPGFDLFEQVRDDLLTAITRAQPSYVYMPSPGAGTLFEPRTAYVPGPAEVKKGDSLVGSLGYVDDPVDQAGQLVAADVARAERVLNDQTRGPAWVEGRRDFIRQFDNGKRDDDLAREAKVARESEGAETPLADELAEARSTVFLIDRYFRWNKTIPAVREAVFAGDEKVAQQLARTTGAYDALIAQVRGGYTGRVVDPVSGQPIRGDNEAIVRALERRRAAHVKASPPPAHVPPPGVTYRSGLTSPGGRPVAAQNQHPGIYVDPVLMHEKYEAKAWAHPPELDDGSRVAALPEDQFATYAEFEAFTVRHEELHDTVLRAEGETLGAYETRVNEEALGRPAPAPEPAPAPAAPGAAPAGGAPPPPEEPPLPPEPPVGEVPDPDEWVDGFGRTDGQPDPSMEHLENGRNIWMGLGMPELDYYQSLIYKARQELMGATTDARRAQLHQQLDSLSLAIYALKRRSATGLPRRRTVKEAQREAEKVRGRMLGVIPPRFMGYFAKTIEGMRVEHYRALRVRVARAREHGRVAGRGLSPKVMAAYRPEHWDHLTDYVTHRLHEVQPQRQASLGRTATRDINAPKEREYVETITDKSPHIRRVIQDAINEYCDAAKIPRWDIELYQRQRTLVAGSQQRMRRGSRMLEQVGGDRDEYLALRQGMADDEGVKQVEWLLMDEPLLTADEAARMVELRFRQKGIVIPDEEMLTESDAFMLESMFQHYSGVTDLNDADQIKAALSAHDTLPPTDAKYNAREYLEDVGMWSPRTQDDVMTKGAWSLDQEREHWQLHYGQQPQFISDARFDDGTIFETRRGYVDINQEIGNMDDAARVKRNLSKDSRDIKLEDHVRGNEKYGIKRTRDWMVERKWAMERYGHRVHKDGVMYRMPWLMTPTEYRQYLYDHGPVEGMIESASDIYSVQQAIHEVVGEYVGYFMKMADEPAAGVVGVASEDIHMMTMWVAQQLLATTPWKKGLKRLSKRGTVDVIGTFFTGLTMMHPAFTLSNAVDIHTRAGIFQWSEKMAKRGDPSPRAIAAITSSESVGMGQPSAFFYSTGGRTPNERILHPWSVTDRVGGVWDKVTGGMARKVLPAVEEAARVRLMRAFFDGMFDVTMAQAKKAGFGEEVAILVTKRRVAEQMRRLFPSLEDAGMAERMLNRLLPFISYNFKNKLLWTGWVLDHPWSIDILREAQKQLAMWNQKQWQQDHPGQRMPEHLLHQIPIPFTGVYIDVGMFTDAARGAEWITGTGNKYEGIEAFIRYWIRPLPQQEALARALIWDITGYGGRKKTRKVLDENGVWDGESYEEYYAAPGTAWGDREFDYLNDMLPFVGLRRVIGDALREGKVDAHTAVRLIGGLVEFGEFGYPSETTMLQYQYYEIQKRMGYDAANEWLLTEDGARLKELWRQQFFDPDNPMMPRGTAGTMNEFQSLFYERKGDEWVFRAPDPKELRKRWLSLQSPTIGDEVREARDLQFKLWDSFDAKMEALDWGDSEARQELWMERRSAEVMLYAANPNYLVYKYFGTEPEEYEEARAKASIDTERNEFMARYDFEDAPEYGTKARQAWDEDRLAYLTAHPELARTFADEYSSFQASQNRVSEAHGRAIELGERLDRVRDIAYDAGNPKAAAAVSALRDRQAHAFDAEAFGYDEDGKFQMKPDSTWKKLLRGDDPAKAWYGTMMGQIGRQATVNGQFDAGRWWKLVNRNPALRAEHLTQQGITAGEWEQKGKYNDFWSRWHSLADRGRPQDWDRAWQMWENAPQWLKDEYEERSPSGFREFQRDSQYNTYMGKWVGMFDTVGSAAAMRYFNNLPGWAKARYYENHKGKQLRKGESMEYIQTLDRMFNQIDAGNWEAAERIWLSAPSWVRSHYYANNPDSTLFRGGGGSGGGSSAYSQMLDRMFGQIDAGNWDAAEKIWNSAPASMRAQYYKNNPSSTLFRGGSGGGFSGGGSSGKMSLSDPQFRSYLSMMKTWVSLMKQGDDSKADRYFRSLPDWAKRFYLQRNPDKEVLMLDDRLFSMAMDYFSSDPEEQRALLQRSPALARWLNSHDTGKARNDALMFIYSRLPQDAWLRRVFRERYPEVFSAEAKGKQTVDSIFAILGKHPDLAEDWMRWYKHIAGELEEALRWAEPRPDQPVLDRAALRAPTRGLSAEAVSLGKGVPVMRTPKVREREPLAD